MIIRVLVASDTAVERRRVVRLVSGSGVEVEPLGRRENLWERLSRGDHDLVILDRARIADPPEPFVLAVRDRPEKP